MKKSLSLLLCRILCIVLCACAAGCADSDRNSGAVDHMTDTTAYITTDPPIDTSHITEASTLSPEDTVFPDVQMMLLDGRMVFLSDFRQKKVILNFWATWCPPCVGEMPAFQRLTEEYPDQLVILAINCSESAEAVQAFVDRNGYTFPVVLDISGRIQAVIGGVPSIPVTIILDEEGHIISSTVGAYDAETMYQIYKEKLGF